MGATPPVIVVTYNSGDPNLYYCGRTLLTGVTWSVIAAGSAGAWTGFTMLTRQSFTGTFNWVAVGNPD